jgi:hypothetical protein
VQNYLSASVACVTCRCIRTVELSRYQRTEEEMNSAVVIVTLVACWQLALAADVDVDAPGVCECPNGPNTCSMGYMGTQDQCYCWCNGIERGRGGACKYTPMSSFSAGSCSYCPERFASEDSELLTALTPESKDGQPVEMKSVVAPSKPASVETSKPIAEEKTAAETSEETAAVETTAAVGPFFVDKCYCAQGGCGSTQGYWGNQPQCIDWCKSMAPLFQRPGSQTCRYAPKSQVYPGSCSVCGVVDPCSRSSSSSSGSWWSSSSSSGRLHGENSAVSTSVNLVVVMVAMLAGYVAAF